MADGRCVPSPDPWLTLLNDHSTVVTEIRYWLLTTIELIGVSTKVDTYFAVSVEGGFIFVLFLSCLESFPIPPSEATQGSPASPCLTLPWVTQSCYFQFYLFCTPSSRTFPSMKHGVSHISLDHVDLSSLMTMLLLPEWPYVLVILEQKKKILGDVI